MSDVRHGSRVLPTGVANVRERRGIGGEAKVPEGGGHDTRAC